MIQSAVSRTETLVNIQHLVGGWLSFVRNKTVGCRWHSLVLGLGAGRTKKSMLIGISSQLQEVTILWYFRWWHPLRVSQPVPRGPQQAWVCTARPGHGVPSFLGGGLLHSLLLSWVPDVQADQELQQLQWPSALAPAQIISQGRRQLAYKKQLRQLGGRTTCCPRVVRNPSSGKCLGVANQDLCSPPIT